MAEVWRPEPMTPQTDRKPTIVGIGELLWDCFPNSRRAGGAPANVAFHANQFGNTGIICTSVGRDDDGQQLITHCQSNGLSTEYIQRDPDHQTGTVTVDTTRPDHPDYTIHENVAWDHIKWNVALARLAEQADAVCFGTLAQRAPESRATIHAFLQRSKALRICDINLRPPWFDDSIIRTSLLQCDVLKLNHEEINMIADTQKLKSQDIASISAALLHQFDLNLICVTQADRGCHFQTPDQQLDVQGRSVNVVDAVGAGDAFTAAMVTGLLRRWPLETTANIANAIGAEVAAHAGAMPKLADRFQKIKLDYAAD